MATTNDGLNETTAPHFPFYTIAPENFRRVMQKQIAAHVKKEVDGITQFSKSTLPDGRFSSSLPSETIYMSNSDGFHYFIVGATKVGFGAVAAP